MESPRDDKRVLIIGCGYLGLRVAKAWLERNRRVIALTRSKSVEFQALGIEPICGDVNNVATLQNLPQVATVLYAIGLDRKTGVPMKTVYVDGLNHVLDSLPRPDKFIYISSTSVYSQTDGSFVDETSATEPVEESGQIVLAAEKTLRHALPEAVILRFSGIYGPQRLLRQQPLLRGEPLVGDADRWLNLIHVDDGVRAVLAAEEQAKPGETYLIADDTPVTRREFYTELAQLLGAPRAAFLPGESTRGDSHRRVNNSKACRDLGFVPKYASYKTGLQAAIHG